MEREAELLKISVRSVLKLTLILGVVCGLLIGGGLGFMEGNIIEDLTNGALWGILIAFSAAFFAYIYNLFAAITGGIKLKLKFKIEAEDE